MLYKLQCLYGRESYATIEDVDEPSCSSSDPESVKATNNEKKRRKRKKNDY